MKNPVRDRRNWISKAGLCQKSQSMAGFPAVKALPAGHFHNHSRLQNNESKSVFRTTTSAWVRFPVAHSEESPIVCITRSSPNGKPDLSQIFISGLLPIPRTRKPVARLKLPRTSTRAQHRPFCTDAARPTPPN